MLHSKDGDYIYFNSPWTALIKTSTMFVGELEFADVAGVINVDSPMAPLAFAFLLAFVFLIVVVLMSLLNGLAVSDTGVIQAKAEIVGYISRVETISYTESVLLGDPFDFLSNWPAFKWVKSIPSMSFCSQLYRHPSIQGLFHHITGATGILLFYAFLPDKKWTITPNNKKTDICGCLKMSWMDESIVNSAKTILARQMTEHTEDDAGKREKIKHLEDLVTSQSAAIARLEDKLDKLLRLRV